ncbi:MAG TPA: NrfD/PsrC family molybdoenzyme membrane anchor subunit [Acidimicrobiales bacterium]|nr:NrfD/PsrC family molybdoenzyme membrane anchor subunit [Acidimicrobiales bacterium]
MSSDRVTTDGLTGTAPGREATTGVNVPPGGGGPRRRRQEEPQFRSYYGQPIINKPVWESTDIAGYLFLGGLAGASAVLSAAAQLTRRPALARVTKLGAAVAGHLSIVALVHDLGRRSRFVNMLRVFKVTSPMSVGSWLLAGFVPAASAAALSEVTGAAPVLGGLATAGAASLGAPVAAYTAALISDTAVPAWHDGHRYMPFVFVSSALSSATGLGLLGAPVAENAPLRPLAAGAGLVELATEKLMEKRMGVAGEAYHQGKAKTFMRAAEGLTVAGAALAATAGRSRLRAAAGGAALLAGSACTRFGIFHAGLISAEKPEYTVEPQRQRLDRRREQP